MWKLERLSEYDIRRPLVSSGTNLLGLVKHLVGVEAGYFGDTFNRPFAEPMPWLGSEGEPNVDMWATAHESREYIVDLYRRVCGHADSTIEELSLEAVGQVPWWPEGRRDATLHRVLAHVVAETETNRHAGHADIIRELIDGGTGLAAQHSNMAPGDEAWWRAYIAKLEEVARVVGRQ